MTEVTKDLDVGTLHHNPMIDALVGHDGDATCSAACCRAAAHILSHKGWTYSRLYKLSVL